MVNEGKSRTLNSKHLRQPDGLGHAVDVVPCNDRGQIDWKDVAAFRRLRTLMLAEAKKQGVKVRHGADWNLDGIIDETQVPFWLKHFKRRPLVDYPHWELVE